MHRELGRRDTMAIAEVTPDAAPDSQALAALRVVRASIDELDNIAGRLARSATEMRVHHGGRICCPPMGARYRHGAKCAQAVAFAAKAERRGPPGRLAGSRQDKAG